MKLIILEGIDAIGKSEIAFAIKEKLKNNNIESIIVNRKSEINLSENQNQLYQIAINWFKNNQKDNSTDLQCLISLIQLQMILDNLKNSSYEMVIIDSWWAKSLCNISYRDIVEKVFSKEQLFIRYEILMNQINNLQQTFLITASPEDAYNIYINKNKPETILGKNNFDKHFYEQYAFHVQRTLKILSKKYNFIEFETKYDKNNYKTIINSISEKIINIILN